MLPKHESTSDYLLNRNHHDQLSDYFTEKQLKFYILLGVIAKLSYKIRYKCII